MKDKMIEELRECCKKYGGHDGTNEFDEMLSRHEATERGDIDLGLCSVFYSEEDKDYCFNPASGRFPLEKIKGKLGQLIFRPAKAAPWVFRPAKETDKNG